MNLLLDTHVALWAVADSPRLPVAIRDLLTRVENRLWVSAVSVWEIAIKNTLARQGVGAMPITALEALGHFRAAGYEMLTVSADHAAAMERLPPLHSDPFDRLLVAQAVEEPLRLITHDKTVATYDSSIILF